MASPKKKGEERGMHFHNVIMVALASGKGTQALCFTLIIFFVRGEKNLSFMPLYGQGKLSRLSTKKEGGEGHAPRRALSTESKERKN